MQDIRARFCARLNLARDLAKTSPKFGVFLPRFLQDSCARFIARFLPAPSSLNLNPLFAPRRRRRRRRPRRRRRCCRRRRRHLGRRRRHYRRHCHHRHHHYRRQFDCCVAAAAADAVPVVIVLPLSWVIFMYKNPLHTSNGFLSQSKILQDLVQDLSSRSEILHKILHEILHENLVTERV